VVHRKNREGKNLFGVVHRKNAGREKGGRGLAYSGGFVIE
jgi:hypothetical protein